MPLTALEACLPNDLRGPGTTIVSIAGGHSGAGVYRVEAAGAAYVLKVAAPDAARATWPRRVEIMRAAAAAGVAPRVVHVDEARCAIVTELVADRMLVARLSPAQRAAAIGATLGRLHALAIPSGAPSMTPIAELAEAWTAPTRDALPAWCRDAIQHVLDEAAPPPVRPPALCHNDLNPSNIVFDGTRMLLLDWDRAGVNDPIFDLATVAVFQRFDDTACAPLLAAAAPTTTAAALATRFRYQQRLVAALCGALFLRLALVGGTAGAPEAFDAAPTLADVHGRIRAGTRDPRAPVGPWSFGLALLKTSVQLRR